MTNPKSLLRRIFAAAGLHIERARPAALDGHVTQNEPNPIQPWRTDAAFTSLMHLMLSRSLVDEVRCYILYQLAIQAARLAGDFAEIGVYKGGTAKLLASTIDASGKKLNLFDTFEGMPETDPERDWHRKGDFSDTSLESVREFLIGHRSVEFFPGFFPGTAVPELHRTFSLVHVDVDIYRSILDCCEYFYPRLTPGAIMVFDDYGFTSCHGAKLAVDEFFDSKPERPLYLPTGQAVVTRLPQ